MIIFECHNFLDAEQLSLIEIELAPLYPNTSENDQYRWLLINKSNLKITELQFKSMDSSYEIEERFFDLGYLKFDPQKGVYISKEPTQYYMLKNNDSKDVPLETIEAITRYLNGKNIIFL